MAMKARTLWHVHRSLPDNAPSIGAECRSVGVLERLGEARRIIRQADNNSPLTLKDPSATMDP